MTGVPEMHPVTGGNKMSVEKGKPTVSVGIYLRVLYALQMENYILLIAKDDPLGRLAQDMELKQRQRASKKE